jgi:hypothetical protein
MSFKQGYLYIKNIITERIFITWLALIILTLLSLLVTESHTPTVWTTFIVCLVVLLKTRMVMDHFMGLKHASRITRWIMNSYVYVMTLLVGFSAAYSQYPFKVDLY